MVLQFSENFLSIDTLTQQVHQLKLNIAPPPWLCQEDNGRDLDYTADCCVVFPVWTPPEKL